MVIHFSFVTYPHLWTLLISNSLLSIMKASLALVSWLYLTYPHIPDKARMNNHQASYLVSICLIFVKQTQIIFKCVTCRSLHGRLGEQKIANLPFARTTETSPFTCCGVDMFGRFYIKEKISEFKRYRAMFVCLASRAVHIEVTHQINTDSFIQVLQRMIARRGNVRLIKSDNGTNFLGAESKLKRVFLGMDNKEIS